MQKPTPIPGYRTASAGWWRRHWRWAIPLSVLLLLGVGGGIIIWSVLRWSEAVRESPPMQEALRRAGCSIEVAQVLGEPLLADAMPLSITQTTVNGERDVGLVVGLEGPQGRARLIVEGTRRNDVWDYPVMYVLGEDQATFDLTALDDAEAAGECALQECRERGGCSEGLAL